MVTHFREDLGIYLAGIFEGDLHPSPNNNGIRYDCEVNHLGNGTTQQDLEREVILFYLQRKFQIRKSGLLIFEGSGGAVEHANANYVSDFRAIFLTCEKLR